MAKQKYYVVWKGRRTGIFTSWVECSASVAGFPGAQYRAFDSRRAAEAALRGSYAETRGRSASPRWLFTASGPALPSICVDAACDGSPGTLEYRGVDTESGRENFHAGPYPDGTNNVGEFLAIVNGLRWLGTQSSEVPLYSDSETAIGWVRAGKCRTGLAHTGRNEQLFDLIAQAEQWLTDHGGKGTLGKASRSVLKWDTAVWGENPADFGRK